MTEEPKCDCMFCSGLAWFRIMDFSDSRYGVGRSPTKEENEKFWKQHDLQKAQRDIELGLIPNPS